MPDEPQDQVDDVTEESVEDDSIIDQMRDSGVGVEDPNITDPASTQIVDDQVQPDEPPKV